MKSKCDSFFLAEVRVSNLNSLPLPAIHSSLSSVFKSPSPVEDEDTFLDKRSE